MSKKFAAFFCVLVLLVAVGTSGMFFVMLRLSAESEMVINLMQSGRSGQAQSSRALAVDRDDWEISRGQFLADAALALTFDDFYYIGKYIPVFYNKNDFEPKGILFLNIVSVQEQQDSWKLVSGSNGEKWIDMDWKPEEFLIDLPGLNQQALGLPTGCEIVALTMVINKYVDIDVFALIEEMPRSYDPLLGFRGDPFTRGGFTILPPALMELTERHLGSARDMTGASVSDVQAQLAIGRPVVAWVRGMFGFYVHAITLTGFNRYGFFYNDPWLGGVNEFITYERFLAMWEDPIRDLRLNRIYPPRMALSY